MSKSLYHIAKLLKCLRTLETTKKKMMSNYFQVLTTASYIEGNIDKVSDSTLHQPANEGERVNNIDGQCVRKKGQTKYYCETFTEAKLDCMSHYAIPIVKSNPDRIIIYYGTNNRKTVQFPEATDEKNIELEKCIISTTNEVVISSIIPGRNKRADKGLRANNVKKYG